METDFLKTAKGQSILPILSDAGFEEGDFLPLYTFNANGDWEVTSTSTTYDAANTISCCWIIWDEMFPEGADVQVFGQGYIQPGADETVDLRIYNGQDGETVDEITGITSTQVVTMGPVSYTPTTTDSGIYIRWNWRTSPGTNALALDVPYTVFGVKL